MSGSKKIPSSAKTSLENMTKRSPYLNNKLALSKGIPYTNTVHSLLV